MPWLDPLQGAREPARILPVCQHASSAYQLHTSADQYKPVAYRRACQGGLGDQSDSGVKPGWLDALQ